MPIASTPAPASKLAIGRLAVRTRQPTKPSTSRGGRPEGQVGHERVEHDAVARGVRQSPLAVGMRARAQARHPAVHGVDDGHRRIEGFEAVAHDRVDQTGLPVEVRVDADRGTARRGSHPAHGQRAAAVLAQDRDRLAEQPITQGH